MTDDLERDLRAALRSAELPAAPLGLEVRVHDLASRPAGRRGTGLGQPALAVAVIVVTGVALLSGLGIGGAAPGPPATINGLAVLSVSQAIAARERGDDSSMAVRGWYQSPMDTLECPALIEPVSDLARDCSTRFTFLMADPEHLIRISSSSVSGSPPTGPAFNVFLETDAADDWAVPLPSEGLSTPTEVVMLGRFHDPRATECSVDRRTWCENVFVVSDVVWAHGIDLR